MMAEKKLTAEQKLLQMIEASSPKGEVAAEAKTKKTVVKKQNALTLVRTSNKILVIGVIASVVFLANEVRSGAALLSKSVQFTINQAVTSRAVRPETLIPSVPAISFYLEGVQQRNIFLPFEKVENAVVDASEQNRRIFNKTRNFRLVGISWLDTVESASVMIEDGEKKVTYYLQKGEKIEDITVKSIYAESAVLGYDNEELTITYDRPQL